MRKHQNTLQNPEYLQSPLQYSSDVSFLYYSMDLSHSKHKPFSMVLLIAQSAAFASATKGLSGSHKGVHGLGSVGLNIWIGQILFIIIIIIIIKLSRKKYKYKYI